MSCKESYHRKDEGFKPCKSPLVKSIAITGHLESVDNDGYTILRLGECIIPFMTIGTPFRVGTKERVNDLWLTVHITGCHVRKYID